MSKNTRRTFLKTVGLAVGTAGMASATLSETPDVSSGGTPAVTQTDDTPPVTPQQSNWATFQYDTANTGYNPDARGVDRTPWIDWSESLAPEFSYPLSTPAIVDGVAYFATDRGGAMAFDTEEREVLWQNEYTDSANWSDNAPTVADGRMYISHGWRVFALDTETGELVWKFQNPETESFPDGCDAPKFGASSTTVVDGTVFFKMRTGKQARCYALSGDTGEIQWSDDVSNGNVTYSVNYGGQMATDDEIPAVVDGVAYFAEAGTVYAFDAADGTRIWEAPVHTGSSVYDPSPRAPTVVDGTVFFAVGFVDKSGEPEGVSYLTALSADDGSVRWQSGGTGSCSPVVDGDTIYAAGTGRVWALSSDDGSVLWKTDETINISQWGLCATDSVVYLSSKGDGSSDSSEVVAFDTDDGSLTWRVPLRGTRNAPSGCALVGDTVYITDNIGVLYSITEPTNGDWRRTPELSRSESFRAASTDTSSVYAATNRTLRAFSRGSGTERWSVSLGERENDTFRYVWTTVADSTVYCALGGDGGSSYNFIYAIDTATGQIRWHKKAPSGVGVPVVVDDVVYFGSESYLYGSSYVKAYDAGDGSHHWTAEFDTDDPGTSVQINSPVVVQNGVVYAATTEGTYALDATDGSQTWTDSRAAAAVAANDDTVFVSTDRLHVHDQKLIAFDPEDGAEKWSSNTAGDSMTLAEDTLYVIAQNLGSSETLFALNTADGSVRWSFETKNGFPTYGYDYEGTLTDPVVENGIVYIGSDDRRVYALDADGGGSVQRFELFDDVRTAPAVRDKTVYAVTGGAVYSFDREE